MSRAGSKTGGEDDAYPVDKGPIPNLNQEREALEHSAEEAVPEYFRVRRRHLPFPTHEAKPPLPLLGRCLACYILCQGAARAAVGPT